MKKLLYILLFVPLALFGQGEIGKINIYVDGGTFGIVNSVFMNAEIHLTSSKSNQLHLYFRGSFGDVILFSGGSGHSSFHTETQALAGSITILTGRDNHHFDSSAGVFLRDDSILPFFDVGYRFQKLEGGIILRGKIGLLGLGLGLGYSF